MTKGRTAPGQSDHGIGIVIVAHDGLAQALLDTLKYIMGPVPRILALDVTDADDEQCVRIVEATRTVDNSAGVVIAADMHGGSPCNLALQAAERADGQVEVAAGTNLPMLVALVENRRLPPADAVETALNQARRCILRSTGHREQHARD